MTKTIFRESMKRWTEWEAANDPGWTSAPKLLLMDGHLAHTDTESIRHLQAVGMRCALPPGASSHMWQVLDNGPIGAFRKQFSRLRVCAAAAAATGVVPCPANVICIRKGLQSQHVFAELSVDVGTDAFESVCLRLKAGRKTKVHSSDTLCAGYCAWRVAISPAVLAGGFLRTGTFASGFTADSKPKCDPAKIKQRLEAHRGGADPGKVEDEAVQAALASLPPELKPTAEQLKRMAKEIAVLRVATNAGLSEDALEPNAAKRSKLNRQLRQLGARTTTDLLAPRDVMAEANERLDAVSAEATDAEAAAGLAKTQAQLDGSLAKARSTLAKARRCLKAAASKGHAEVATAGMSLVYSAGGLLATPDKAALTDILGMTTPQAEASITMVRQLRACVAVAMQSSAATVLAAIASAAPPAEPPAEPPAAPSAAEPPAGQFSDTSEVIAAPSPPAPPLRASKRKRQPSVRAMASS